MELEYGSITTEKYKQFSSPLNKTGNNKEEDNYNSKLVLSDGIFGNKIPVQYNFFLNKELSSSKKNDFLIPNCKIISSLFSQENIQKSFNQSIKSSKINNEISSNNNFSKGNDNGKSININNNFYNNNKENNNISNSYVINYRIYNNIKESSLFHIKIYGKYIKYFPIFSKLTDFEKIICYNPLIETNPNFEIVPLNSYHQNFTVNNYNISAEKLDNLKEKYVNHIFTRKNIISTEEIFKYILEEIKINISCINVQSPYEDVLKNCSNLINNINDIIEDILHENNKKENGFLNMNESQEIIKTNENKTNKEISKSEFINSFDNKNNSNGNSYCIFNNGKVKKNIILNDMNSNCIEDNFFGSKNNEIDKNNYKDNDKKNINDLSEEENNIKSDEKDKKEIKETYSCLYCSRKFTSHCGLGGHMSKRHPKNQNK